MYNLKNMNHITNAKSIDLSEHNVDYSNMMESVLKEMNAIYEQSNRDSYKKIYENANIDTINESVSIFCKSNCVLIDTFVDRLETMKKSFNKELTSSLVENPFLMKSIKDICSTGKIEATSVKLNGFNYNENSNPSVCAKEQFILMLSDIITSPDISKVYDRMKYELTQDYYDKLRGRILDSGDLSISRKNFNNEVFKYFRNGYDYADEITLSGKMIAEIFNKCKDARTYFTTCVNVFFDMIINQFKDIKDIFLKMSCGTPITKGGLSILLFGEVSSYLSATATKTSKEIDSTQTIDPIYLQYIMKIKAKQIIELADIYGVLALNKINACRDCLMQSLNIVDSYIAQTMERGNK